jgi:hypothetical protein
MDAAHVAHSSPIQLGRRLLALLSLERIAVLFDVHQLFRPWLNHLRREGLYKILDYDSTLELLDPQGQTATVKKRVLSCLNYACLWQARIKISL